ncbi:MAG: hypothetical protein VYD70_00775 [Planctomycetota bacterium]|nr:hypothetical protein [Planctomycetota bacterium]
MLYCDDCGTISDKNYGPEDGKIRCPRCAGATEEAPATSGLSLLDEPGSLQGTGIKHSNGKTSDLNLFSTETIAQKRKPKKADGETRLHLVEEDAHDSVEKTDSFHTKNAPRPPQPQQWRFECLACSGSLRLQPVTSRCKIRCPRCQTWMVLGPEGELNLPSTQKKPRRNAKENLIATSDAVDFEDQTMCPTDASQNETTTQQQLTGQKSVTSPSPAALRAVDSQGSGSSDTITLAPPIEELESEKTGQDVLGIIGEDPNDFGHEFDLDAVPQPQQDESSAPSTKLTDATVAIWVGLFVLPSLGALLTARLAPSSEIYQVLSRVGVSVQHSCGDFLTAVSGWMTNL